ncbi:MAG: hypothetical protein DWQ47_16365 [Acidobacteria bacterium]|nr:MAG: hypothetical protein DWQ32_03765 [Acidobacteriota bacterium]REK02374.1 MAG: hypothetical protein DWQ38_08375 [Acidobacteriota bacterium]REK13824.1 MAG: hypothetical protein DWQ43_09455 [Acidobacteriota bacterium]REK41819.1 MAG: hypothetical protein DWQ47_16365 [Acidobacteriota bacterium]
MFGEIERSEKYPDFYKMPEGPGHYFARESAGRLYGLPFLIVFLMELSWKWRQQHPKFPFGIGDIAAEDGDLIADRPHHSSGMAVDIAVIHCDGVQSVDAFRWLTWMDDDYDLERTKDLAATITELGTRFQISEFIYNDPKVKPVKKTWPLISPRQGHDDHFHLTLSGRHPYTDEQMQEIFPEEG